MNLMESIYNRKSVRKYKNEELDENTLNEIAALGNSNIRLYKDISMLVHLVKDGEKIQGISKGIIGSYGKIKAPHYLVITSEVKEGYLENVGFTLEQLVLQLTGMKIGTCWIGGFIKKELLSGIVEIPTNHVPVIVISFGYPSNEGEVTRIIDSSYKRKKLSDFYSGDLNDEWTSIMNAVRRAPSAVNMQPWRFFKEGSFIHVFSVTRTLMKHLEDMHKIDVGIALCHLKVALEAKNISFEFLHNDLSKKGLNYIISLNLNQ